MYGVHASYWFSFLSAAKPPVLFETLKRLDYQIDIVSSTNTNWPEFRKTCYIDVLDDVKDDFKGSPWQKDIQATKYFLSKIDGYDTKKPIFAFVFFDAPHGYSFPPKANIFKADGENVNYITVSKEGKDVKSALAGYKNAVHHDDKLFGKIIAKLKDKGLYDNSMIIFTSDHGQEFYEYGHFGHNSAFSEGQTHTPFIVKPPKGMKLELPTGYPDLLTSHLDVVPTIMKLLGVKTPAKAYSNGENLFSKDYHRDFAFVSSWNDSGVITPAYTYIFSNMPDKFFKNSTKETATYSDAKDQKIGSKMLLEVMDDNRRFIRR